MLKPQTIRDQEFQIAFRGYDPVEVKSYLELVADDYFELSEENRILQEKIITQKSNSNSPSSIFEKEGEADDLQLEIDSSGKETTQSLQAKLAHAESRIKRLSTENMGYLSQINELNKQLEFVEAEAMKELKEGEEMMKQITILAEQNAELKEKSSLVEKDESEMKNLVAEAERLRVENEQYREEERSLKRILISAQSFADTLRDNAEQEAADLLEAAKTEVAATTAQREEVIAHLTTEIEGLKEKKKEAEEELNRVLEFTAQREETVARFTQEIERLGEKKTEVRNVLRKVLEDYLSALDRENVS